ncbi:outer membrane protein insertion porin family [Mangrovibacterium diazotrophicum]|uniref:Outer membrane protein assembly factor BamA n=2 Tax=Mangrovibacterium diazotrophicum TaxID=1261403 RepID=A0A419VW03_9BACT|nr:outer membrane protein insertion porin family [Mangrovibacterium diazotrophicum]
MVLLFTLIAWTAVAQENYEIRKIKFEGNDTIPEETLLEGMILHPTNYFEKKFGQKEPSLYSSELIQTDIERLTKLYQRMGFLDAQVKMLEPEIDDKKEKVELTFKINEGEAFRIDSITYSIGGSGVDFNADSVLSLLREQLYLTKGKRFVDDELGSDVSTIKNEFKNYGYAYARADYKITPKPKERLADIEYIVQPGPKSYFGATSIDGNKHVSEKYIRKQLQYKEGDEYNSSLLDDTRKDMYKLQLFSILSFQPQTTKDQTPNIPVKIYVDEAPRFTSKFGVGYGTEDKIRAFTNLTYKGLWGGARRVNLQLKHSALTPYEINFSYIQPQLFSSDVSLTLNPFFSRIKEPGYDIRDMGLNVKFSQEFTDDLSGYVSYYFEKVKNYEIDSTYLTSGETDIPYNKSGILLSTLFDNSDPKFSPTKGLNISLAYKLNGYIFGGDFNYSRVWTDIRNYQDLDKLVLATRLMIGAIHSGDSDKFIPVEDRFYAGGSNSIRGWQRSELGPLRDDGTPRGGSSAIQASVELRIPLVWKLSVVSFMDFGNVWEQELHYRLNDLAWATGGGIRLETPIGPIRFDVGVPVWNEKRSAEFFLSVGQAF